MAGVLGQNWSATDDLQKAGGAKHDAGARVYKNLFNFADSGLGGTANPITLARVREGSHVHEIDIQTDQNISAINLSVGIVGNTAKYVAAAAGPNAVKQAMIVKLTALDDAELANAEEIILTPSGNWPATGTLFSKVIASHR